LELDLGDIETANISLISPDTSVELSEISVDFSERNASVAKTRNFELLCMGNRAISLFFSCDRIINLIALLFSNFVF
jgi:hypothetical protein